MWLLQSITHICLIWKYKNKSKNSKLSRNNRWFSRANFIYQFVLKWRRRPLVFMFCDIMKQQSMLKRHDFQTRNLIVSGNGLFTHLSFKFCSLFISYLVSFSPIYNCIWVMLFGHLLLLQELMTNSWTLAINSIE